MFGNQKGENKNVFVQIGSSLGGILFIIILMTLIFAKDLAVQIVIPVSASITVIAAAMGYFALRSMKKK